MPSVPLVASCSQSGIPQLRCRIAVLVAILVCSLASQASALEVYDRYHQAVVALTCTSDDGILHYYGTGAVISPTGLILSNITVIPAKARRIRVYFTDGSSLPAKLLGTDRDSEAALIAVSPKKKLTAMPLANADDYQLGDTIYSWGNPHQILQRDGAVCLSRGIISGRYHAASSDSQSRYHGDVLECDAAINPGSDGGPITDAEGRLLGIMSLAFTKTRWMGLAIPVNRMHGTIPALKNIRLHKRPQHLDTIGPGQQIRACLQQAGPAVIGVLAQLQGKRFAAPKQRPQEADRARPIPDHMQAEMERRKPRSIWTTGFFISNKGEALCAASSLADDADSIKALFIYDHHGKRHEAKLVAFDSGADLALLKIAAASEQQQWPFLRLAPNKTPPLGTAVILPGRSEAPGSLTVTYGRLSGLHRYQGQVLQFSAASNHGNVGGPLLGLDGQVYGIANLLFEDVPWRQNCGVGFALRGSVIKQHLDELRQGKDMPLKRRSFMGVHIEGDQAKHNQNAGLRILKVVPDSPAAKAKLQANDRILALDDEQVTGWFHFSELLEQCIPGQLIKITIRRAEKHIQLSLELGGRGS